MKREQSLKTAVQRRKMNEFKGYSYFNDIDDQLHRAYNRAQIIYNLNDLGRKDLIEGYFEGLDKPEQTKLYLMMAYINEKGQEIVSREIASRVEVIDE